jgi:hypothetical protein
MGEIAMNEHDDMNCEPAIPTRCAGHNCGTTTAQHSPECILEAAIIQGWSTEDTLAAAKAVFDARATPPAAQVQGEQPEVVAWRYGFSGGIVSDKACLDEWKTDGEYQPLMTVAQHERIVSWLKADIFHHEQLATEALEFRQELIQQRDEARAAHLLQLAHHVLANDEEFTNSGDVVAISAEKRAEMAQQIAEFLKTLYAAPTPPASEQQQAVVVLDEMRTLLSRALVQIEHLAECTENLGEDLDDDDVSEDVVEARAVAWEIDQLLRLNPHLAGVNQGVTVAGNGGDA